MKVRNFVFVLLLMAAGLQTSLAQKQRSVPEGKAKVVLYMSGGQSYEYEILQLDSMVFVEAVPAPKLVTQIVLDKTSLTLQPGGMDVLSATVYPSDAENKAVAWESSNTAVAVVASNGTVVAVSNGTCTITCRATDGSGVKAECQVTVEEPINTESLLIGTWQMYFGTNDYILLTFNQNGTVHCQEFDNGQWEEDAIYTYTFINNILKFIRSDGRIKETIEVINLTATELVLKDWPDGGVNTFIRQGNTPQPETHEYVDLGLPSGTLWATCNVGANSPEGYGDFFAWGETQPKTTYSWSTYKWCKGSENTMTKYCTQGSNGYNGFTDNKTELEAADDAATANWGSNWQMPSSAQLQELYNSSYTTMTWTTVNGVNGRQITSNKNGNSIFLPASHRASIYVGRQGTYWSRSLVTGNCILATQLIFTSDIITWNSDSRYEGMSVRPVRVQNNPVPKLVTQIALSSTSLSLQVGETGSLTATVYPTDADNKTVAWESSNSSVATVSNSGLVTAVAAGTCTITCRATDGSGVKAECQVTVEEPINTESLLIGTWQMYFGTNDYILLTFNQNGTVRCQEFDNGQWEEDAIYTYTFINNILKFIRSDGRIKETIEVINLTATELVLKDWPDGGVNTFIRQGNTPQPETHEYVEIGGLKWATMNLGATTIAGSYETCFGDYYAWGETTPRYMTMTRTGVNAATFTWKNTYGSGYSSSNYPTYTGSKLDAAHDAATAQMGEGWRTPTKADFEALAMACSGSSANSQTPISLINKITSGGIYWLSATQTYEPEYTGVAGILFVDKNNIDNRVFFPAAGSVYDTSLINGGTNGDYWSSTLDTSDSSYAYYLYFYSSGVNPSFNYYRYRCHGFTVRPVSD